MLFFYFDHSLILNSYHRNPMTHLRKWIQLRIWTLNDQIRSEWYAFGQGVNSITSRNSFHYQRYGNQKPERPVSRCGTKQQKIFFNRKMIEEKNIVKCPRAVRKTLWQKKISQNMQIWNMRVFALISNRLNNKKRFSS